MEIKFKETMTALHEYFTELKDLKEAGLDLIKFDAHKTLYNIVIKNLIEQYGFDEAGVMIQNAYEGKVSDSDLDALYHLIGAANTDENIPEEPVKEESPKYFVDDKPVSKEEYEKALEDAQRVFASFSNDWILRNILG